MSEHVHFDRERATEMFRLPNRDDERPVLFDIEALIASLEGDERITALRQALDAAEQRQMERIAHLMLHSGRPVDQRKVDYTRGYYAGARYWLGGRLSDAQHRIAIEALRDIEESEDSV